MPIFLSEKRSRTGGQCPQPAVNVTCASYEETARLARACQRSGVPIAWTLPDLERESHWTYNTRVKTQGRIRADKVSLLQDLVRELYDRDDAIIEIPEPYYDLACFFQRVEVWELCFEGDAKERKIAEKWLRSKKLWLLTQVLQSEDRIVDLDSVMGPERSEESRNDLKNLIERIENLDLGHCSRVNLRTIRAKERKEREEERILGESMEPTPSIPDL